jgi:hypothetical protein
MARIRLICLVALACAVAGCTGPRPATAPPPSTPASASPSTQVTMSAAPVLPPGSDESEPPPAPPAGQASAAAAGFAAAWVRSDLPAERWLAAVVPWCEAGFAAVLRTVDPANLPASRVTGRPVAVSPPADGSAVFTVATDGGTLTVVVAAVNGRWLVSGNDFRRDSS